MTVLVPIPWQTKPQLYLAPSTLVLLKRASDRLGHNIILSSSDAAWRAYARQEYLWDLNGHNPAKANNPAVGQRSHMRGAAFDVINTDPTTQAACRAVGLIRDANEPWHWNDPNWANMPIIPNNTSTAGSGGTLIPKEDDMPLTPADIALLLNSTAYTGGPTISQVLKNLDIEAAPVSRDGKNIPVRQDNADTNSFVRQLLARAVTGTAPGAPLTAAEIAKAVNDDAANRLAS